MENKDTGILIKERNAKLQRFYFKEAVRLKGINVIYRAPRKDKHYNGYGELNTYFYDPVVVGCLYEEHPKQHTMRKLGWNTEGSENVSIIQVPYDLEGLERGGMFIIPSALDHTQGRAFTIIDMSTISMYPSSVTCELGPVWESTYQKSESVDYTKSDFNLLNEEAD